MNNRHKQSGKSSTSIVNLQEADKPDIGTADADADAQFLDTLIKMPKKKLP